MASLPEFITRIKGISQKLIDLSNTSDDFVNVAESERDKGYGLFSLRSSGAPPGVKQVRRRAKKRLHGDSYLHSGRRNKVI